MREETRKRLDRAIWIDRAKMAGVGVAIIAAIGLAFGFETLDLKVTDSVMAGTVQEIDPLVAKGAAAVDGEMVVVKLTDGEIVRVLALKSRGLKNGDPIDVIAHHHATGRTTHTLK